MIDVIGAIRTLRAEYSVEPGKSVDVVLVAKDCSALLESERDHIVRMARLENFTIQESAYDGEHAASAFTKHAEIHVPLEGLIDIEKEVARLTKERGEVEGFLKSVQAKLGNAKFTENAAEEIVAKEKQKEADAKDRLRKIEAKLGALS